MTTSIEANAICCVCGTDKEDPVSGFCVNGHDDWLEEEDGLDRWMYAMKSLDMDFLTLKNKFPNKR